MHEFKHLFLAFGLVFCLGSFQNKTYAQVCPMITSSNSMPDCSAGCNVCPGDNIDFMVTGDDLPDGGTIDWYSSPTPGFNPYLSQGTLVGSSTISTPAGAPCTDCPEILAIMVDACAGAAPSPEGANEFMIISSGSGFTVSDLSLDFAPQNNSGGPASDDINVGATCNWQAGNPSLITGCSNVIPAGPGTYIPAGSTVVIQTSTGGNHVYDFSGTCAITDCIYVISNTCNRAAFGGFTNCDGNGIRNYTIYLNSCACTNTATYSTDDPAFDCPGGSSPSDNGTYYINGAGFGNDGCPNAPAIAASPPSSNPSTISTFTYTVSSADCTGSPLYFVGISNPAASNCCSDVFTDYFEVNASCPMAMTGVTVTGCNIGNGTANFDLTTGDAAVSGGSGTVNWYTDAAGTMLVPNFSNYNSGNGTVFATLVLGCESTTVPVTLMVENGPIANPGGDITVCGNQPVMLTGSVTPSANGGIWFSSGDGTFDDLTNPITNYNPGVSDVTNGTVTLTLIANAGPNCPGTTNSLTLTIQAPPTANAGGPYNICSGQTVPLNGSIGGSGMSGSWVTFGDGTFNNPNISNAVYTPGLGDQGLGTVNLQFTVSSTNPGCMDAVVMTTVTIAQGPTATIQGDADVCSNSAANLTVNTTGPAGTILWSTSGGDGSFSAPTAAATNYTPGLGDIALGFVTVEVTVNSTNGCPPATDMYFIMINQGDQISPTVPSTSCGGDDIVLSLSSTGGFGSVTWSTATGDGSFSNAANSTTTYTPGPGDILAGNVQIQVSVLNPPCTNYMDNFSIDLVPDPEYILNANPTSLCGPGSINLDAVANSSNTGAINWSTSGDGSFDNATILTPIYTVGTTDITNGTVTLYAQSTSLNVNCNNSLDSIIISIGTAPTATINGSPMGCDDDNISLDVIIGNGATMVTWSTSGDGSFNNVNSLTPIYTPGSSDQGSGTVTITVTTDSPSANCPAATDMIVIPIDSSPTIMVSIAGPAPICGMQQFILTGGGTNTGVITWSTSGNGTFGANTGSPTTYTPSNNDVTNGSVTIYATTEDPVGPCLAAIDSVVVNISEPVTAGTANAPTLVCDDATDLINLFNELTGADTGGTWTEISGTPSTGSAFNAGAGTFNVSGQIPNIYEFQYLVTGVAPCPNDNAVVTVEIIASPTATVTNSGQICNDFAQGSIFDFDALVTAGDQTGSWADTDGAGVDVITNSAMVDFDGVTAGTYTFTYTTNSAVTPCLEVEYTAEITVENCACPSPATGPLPDLCNDAGTLDLSTFIITTENGSWSITDTPTGSNPAGLTGNQFMGNGSDAGSYTLTFTLDGGPYANCPDSSVQILILNPAVTAGSANPTFNICEDQAQVINLFDELNGENSGGTWTETSAIPSTGGAFNSSGSFNTAGQNAGLYTFEYFMDGMDPCADDTEVVSINIIAPPTATVTATAVVCDETAQGSIVNFDALVTAGDMSGSWVETGTSSGVNLSNTNSVDFDGIPIGIYIFTYTTNSATSPCLEQDYTTAITVENCTCPSPATSAIPDLCSDAADIDLSTFVVTTESGSWAITNSPVGIDPATIIGNNFNGTGNDPGTYTLTFTLDAAPLATCPDSSVQTLTIQQVQSAGNQPNPLVVCSDDINPLINLFDQLTGEDPGGNWIETSGTPSTGGAFNPAGTFDITGQNAAVYTFAYLIMDSGPCPSLSSQVNIEIIQAPSVLVTANAQVCNLTADGSILNFNNLIIAGDMSGSWVETGPGPSGVNLSNPAAVDFDGIAPGIYIFTYTTNSAVAPCQEQDVFTTVTVENCACPSPATATIPDVCEDAVNVDLTTFVVTTEPGSWAITGTPAGANPAIISGNNFTGIGSDVGIYTLTFTLDAAPLMNCPDSSVQTITINPEPVATVTNNAQICNSTADGSILNFDLLVTAGDQTGSWTETSTLPSGVNLSNTLAVDFNGIAAGVYTFTYTTNSAISPCQEQDYTTSITVEDCACPSTQTAPLPDLCDGSAILILDGYVITTETGSWSVTGTPVGSSPGTITGNSFNGNGADPGIYTLTFTLDAAPLATCPDSSVQTLELFLPPNSGTATFNLSACNSDATAINLDQFLFGADLTGSWTETSSTLSTGGAFNAVTGMFTALNQVGGIYSFTYTVAGNASCAPASTEYMIFVEEEASAMVTTSATICNDATNGSVINFNSFIISGDNTGDWDDTNNSFVDLTNYNSVDFDGVPPGNYIFTYTIGTASQFCNPVDYTTTITVENCLCPTPATLAVPDFCQNNTDVDLFDYNFPGQLGSWAVTDGPVGATLPTISGGNLINISGGDPGTFELTFTLAAAPIAGCPDSSVVSFDILPLAVFNLDSTLCSGDSIVVNGTTYNEILFTGTEIFPGAASNTCDSIVNINLMFVTQVVLDPIIDTLCIGDSLVVNNVVFNETNLSDQVIFNNSGCDSSQIVTVSYYPPATGQLDTTLCAGETLTINGVTFTETSPSGPVEFMDGSVNGCDSTLFVNVTYQNSIGTAMSGDQAVCLGDPANISFSFTAGNNFDIVYTVNGTPVNLTGVGNNHTETVMINMDTQFEMISATSAGLSCPINLPAPINVQVIDLAPDVQLSDYNGFGVSCNGNADGMATITINGGTAPIAFNWENDVPDLDNLDPGNYSATVTDDFGCVDSLSFAINEPGPTDFSFTANPIECPGDFSGSIVINNITGPGSDYSYSLDNVNFSAIPFLPFEINGLAAGSVNIFIEDENNCGSTAATSIPVTNDLLVDLIPDQTIELGDSVQLEVNANFTISSISWSPSASLDCNNCSNPVAKPTKTTQYTVVIIDESGCEVELTFELKVQKSRVYVPNVFSPNGDGLNDEFFVQTSSDNIIIEQFMIVDRWGEIVFQSKNSKPNDASLGWNGQLGGKNMNAAVFVYYIQLKYPDGTVVPMKGDVTLLR